MSNWKAETKDPQKHVTMTIMKRDKHLSDNLRHGWTQVSNKNIVVIPASLILQICCYCCFPAGLKHGLQCLNTACSPLLN